jgi:hypothetical protein
MLFAVLSCLGVDFLKQALSLSYRLVMWSDCNFVDPLFSGVVAAYI